MDLSEFDRERDALAVSLDDRGHLAVTIDRPDSLNAIDDAVREGVVDLLRSARTKRSCRRPNL